MKNNKRFEYKYDSLADALAIVFDNGLSYGNTITLDNNIIVDVSNNGIPISIEVLDLSKMLNIQKELLKASVIDNLRIMKDIEKIMIEFTIKVDIHNSVGIQNLTSHSFNNEFNGIFFEESTSSNVYSADAKASILV